jgi:hypothetical protein
MAPAVLPVYTQLKGETAAVAAAAATQHFHAIGFR